MARHRLTCNRQVHIGEQRANLVEIVSDLVEIAPIWSDPGQSWPKSRHIWSKSSHSGQIWAKSDPNRANSADVAQAVRSNLIRICFDRILHYLGPKSSTGLDLTELRPTSGKFRASSTKFGPRLVNLRLHPSKLRGPRNIFSDRKIRPIARPPDHRSAIARHAPRGCLRRRWRRR